MKPFYLLGALLLSLPAAAQTLTNTGTQLTVGAGATFYVQGSVHNQTGGTLTNAGTLQLTGNLTNAGQLSSAGTLTFAGTTSQTFTPGSATVGQLIQNNAGPVQDNTLIIPGNLTLSTGLTLTQGMVRTSPAATLTLADGAVLSGEATGRYVQGHLRIIDAAGSGVQDFGNGLTLDRTGLGQVTVTRTAGLLTANTSYGVNPANNTQRGIDRIWEVSTSTPPTAPLAVSLAWISDDDNGLTDFGASQGWHADAGATNWQAIGARGAASVDAGTGTRSFSFTVPASSGLARFTVSNATTPLPITLVSFTANRQGNAAQLRWETSMELNTNRFEVESSADGISFRKIGQLPGHDFSQQLQRYQFTDENLARYGSPVVYYRIRQVDHNGSVYITPVRTVQVMVQQQVAVYPNPFSLGQSPRIQVQLPQAAPVELVLHDAVGRVVMRQRQTLAAGTSHLTLDGAKLVQGMYVLNVVTPQERHTIRLVCK